MGCARDAVSVASYQGLVLFWIMIKGISPFVEYINLGHWLAGDILEARGSI